jgi:UDP-2,4-diacetamido-2,4,6-trideoxy-beta-L-altropyranose hydrolase
MVTLTARRADASDAELLRQWRNDPETRRRSFTKASVSAAEHRSWLQTRLASDRAAIWIFSDAGVPVGQVRVDIDGDVAEVSIVVAPERRGRGHGKAMLSEAMGLLHRDFGSRLRARALVLDDHEASLRTFKACGFRVVGPAARDDGQRATVLELEAGR